MFRALLLLMSLTIVAVACDRDPTAPRSVSRVHNSPECRRLLRYLIEESIITEGVRYSDAQRSFSDRCLGSGGAEMGLELPPGQ